MSPRQISLSWWFVLPLAGQPEPLRSPVGSVMGSSVVADQLMNWTQRNAQAIARVAAFALANQRALGD